MQVEERFPTQAVPVAVVSTSAWLGRGLYYDVLALSLNLLSAVAVAIDIYAAGYMRAATSVSATASFEPLARIGVELAVFAASFAWIAARVTRAAFRELPRVG